MKSFAHKVVVDSRWVVTRKIPISSENISEVKKRLDSALCGSPGVIEVDVDHKISKILVEYDVTKIQYKAVLEQIVKAGGAIKDNYWFRWKQGWIEFAETNMRDNAKAPPPACCNKPPR